MVMVLKMAGLPVEGSFDTMGNATGLPVAQPSVPTQEPDQYSYDTIINRLLGTGGEERYQLWPEKMVRDALAAPSQAIAAGNAPNPYKEGSEEWQDFESRRTAALPQALSMASLAGTGGLGGVERRLATKALKDVDARNVIPKQFVKGTKDDTGVWFLEGDKPIYANAARSSVDKLYGADKAKAFDNFESISDKNANGNPITVWYRPGEKERALAEVQNFKDKVNASTPADNARLHYESGVNLGYPEEMARAYAYQRFGVDPAPDGSFILGAGPFLRPALKFNEKIYKAPMGGQHLDALPKDMIPEFNRLAMSGEDISHYDFGFMNHKGQFLSREKALQYAIDEGLLHPNSEAARSGTLTSTMDLMSDSSKPGQVIKALEKPSQLNTPREPTLADMKKANVADVLLSTARDPQSIGMDWSPLAQRKTYEPLIKGYEDLPIAVKLNNGEHLIYDGRHRTVMDINSGADKKKMYVLNAKDYDPANAGRTPAKQTMSDDELLKQLKDDK
jgi:cytochrome c556